MCKYLTHTHTHTHTSVEGIALSLSCSVAESMSDMDSLTSPISLPVSESANREGDVYMYVQELKKND